jgi:hypothetical protein
MNPNQFKAGLLCQLLFTRLTLMVRLMGAGEGGSGDDGLLKYILNLRIK